ncbi:MAG: ABC-type transport auxiliary lipoprotein family protein [Candidatus Binatia bacterium]
MRLRILLFCGLLAACSALPPADAPPIRTYRIDYPVPPPAPVTAPFTLRVIPFGTAATYDRPGFIYRTATYDFGIDFYNRWAVAPGSMLTDLVARDIAAAQLVRAVLQAPSAIPTDYELHGEIEEFEERDTGGGAAHLRMRAFLVQVPRTGPRTVVVNEIIEIDEPCRPGDPESFTAAMSRAAQRASEMLRAHIAQALEAGE